MEAVPQRQQLSTTLGTYVYVLEKGHKYAANLDFN